MKRQPRSPMAAVFGLLALWVGIELLYASKWLSLTASDRPTAQASRPTNTLRDLLTRQPGQPVAKVWFAPYTTFPESGYVESIWRSGVYDTFRSFPSSGLKTNYGAFKLSLADSLFTQTSHQGLSQEAELAKDLGYESLALDTGAVEIPAAIPRLCKRTPGCKLASDGYALFPLGTGRTAWIASLRNIRRRLPDVLEINAGQRWGALVFQPDQWWRPDLQKVTNGGAIALWARPLESVSLYRHDLTALPTKAARRLQALDRRIQLRLAPGLEAADLCLETTPASRPGPQAGCRRIHLTHKSPVTELGPLLMPGRVTRIELVMVLGEGGCRPH